MTETIAVMTALFPKDHERALAGEEHLLLSAGHAILATEVRTVDLEASAAALAGRWIHTGEARSLDDEGFLFVSDRVNDMMISEGVSTYPRKIEDVLFQLPAIADAAVIGVPDEKWGETVKAAIEVKDGESLAEAEVHAPWRANSPTAHEPVRGGPEVLVEDHGRTSERERMQMTLQ
ncbi:MAG: acyl-coenzyme A synthetase/AMP-(fatty) acid ligase [Ilumatobacter sp.]|jgi:acyl-coenzyme A synthetase/AMP-(fatty) acid ligase